MISAIHTLTSRPKMEIVEVLHSRNTPDEIASELGMTRQAVDKNIKDLLKFGIVYRTWKTGSGRPKVEFYLSVMGKELYRNLEKLMREYREEGSASTIQMLRDLDLAFINGEVNAQRYREMGEEIKEQQKWFLEQK